mmetsp:Transcript_44646/g.83840  ORF Transcript_44646/g.83840 Transcript_44646/m.83840 type:complete len:233 (-) Transcript_44646:898-1596(-)
MTPSSQASNAFVSWLTDASNSVLELSFCSAAGFVTSTFCSSTLSLLRLSLGTCTGLCIGIFPAPCFVLPTFKDSTSCSSDSSVSSSSCCASGAAWSSLLQQLPLSCCSSFSATGLCSETTTASCRASGASWVVVGSSSGDFSLGAAGAGKTAGGGPSILFFRADILARICSAAVGGPLTRISVGLLPSADLDINTGSIFFTRAPGLANILPGAPFLTSAAASPEDFAIGFKG